MKRDAMIDTDPTGFDGISEGDSVKCGCGRRTADADGGRRTEKKRKKIIEKKLYEKQ